MEDASESRERVAGPFRTRLLGGDVGRGREGDEGEGGIRDEDDVRRCAGVVGRERERDGVCGGGGVGSC